MTTRGIETGKEIDPQRLLRDTRTLGEKIALFFQKPSNTALVMICSVVLMISYPGLAILCFIFALFIYLYAVRQKQRSPIFLTY